MRRKWDVSSRDVRKKCVDEIIARVDEQGFEIGIIAAEDIMDIVAQHIGPDIYNLGLKDTKKLVQDRFADIETEIDLLENQS